MSIGSNISHSSKDDINHIYFYDSGKMFPYVGMIAHDQAHNMAKAAVSALNDGECEIAAFYLGQMTHYIADLSNFCHVLDTSQLEFCYDVYSKVTYENRINRFTSKKNYQGVFSVNFGIPSSLFGRDPSELALIMAKQNRFGDDSCHYYPAKEFENKYVDLRSPIWWRDDRIIETEIFDTIQWNLNNAIDACAAALDWVIDTAKFEGCKYNKKDMSRVHDSLASKLANTVAKSFTKLMIWLGQWAVVYAGGAETFKEVSKKIPVPT